ncbi:macro domain-containing protein [Actinoplanes regularis]|uniref:O-acetyl-ADP-ribose deacetylase (Regulator of RNase III), contains Macro domain n=1 Tax=Actinoplanes regularis TaxID=52697 RepID=A0A238ZT32_9ACTN|nr:macro domain-containing protein [Actinoplanes regularis]GIE90285.1 Appr-1-p processing protein [Actinoplanes regularis]SNR86485.1 O-acetyl-ADP-ribose deacetylase (regulator of RNase III), contains Macro domain [Actinoplanes regularis]
MRNLIFVEGDATDPVGDGPRIIAHVCNDLGAWGRGIVQAISRRWPSPEREFRRWHRDSADAVERDTAAFRLGAVQMVAVGPELWVANLVGQHGITTERGLRTSTGYEPDGGPPVRYDAIREGLTTLTDQARARGASVHMPRIGCGLAGGTWSEVEPLILATLCARDVPTIVYDLPS